MNDVLLHFYYRSLFTCYLIVWYASFLLTQGSKLPENKDVIIKSICVLIVLGK